MRSRTLTAHENRIVGILCDDWRNLLRCTTIDQAMERMDVPFSHAQRLRIAGSLLTNARAANLMRWEPATYVLTNEEKIFARLILRAAPSLHIIPDLADLHTVGVDWSSAGIPQALETLEWLRFLRRSLGGYEIAPDHDRFLNGIGFNFHEVVLPAHGERFNTNCALDFFIMAHPPTRERVLAQIASGNLPEVAGEGMSQKMIDAIRAASRAGNSGLAESADYTNERAVLNDACAWTAQPISIALDAGKITEVTPESTWYLRGGGCGVNNLFRSEEALGSWLTEHPQFRDREAGPLACIFEDPDHSPHSSETATRTVKREKFMRGSKTRRCCLGQC